MAANCLQLEVHSSRSLNRRGEPTLELAERETLNIFTGESAREKQLKGNLFFAIFDVKKVS